jgi:hypothetical protein
MGGGNEFVTHMYITVPFKGNFPKKRIRGIVMRALDALTPKDPSSPKFKFRPLMPQVLARHVNTRWEDIDPRHLADEKWFVAMRVDAGPGAWFRVTSVDKAYGCGLDRLNACYRHFEALMAVAPASLSAHVDVSRIRIMSAVNLTGLFEGFQTKEEEEEAASRASGYDVDSDSDLGKGEGTGTGTGSDSCEGLDSSTGSRVLMTQRPTRAFSIANPMSTTRTSCLNPARMMDLRRMTEP